MFAPPRLVCVLIPNLPVQVERQSRAPEGPVLIASPGGTDRVLAASAEAQAAGVVAGMALEQARQAAPEAIVLAPDDDEYHRRHEAALAALQAYTPEVETVALGEFLLDGIGLNRDDRDLAMELAEAAHAASSLGVQVGVARGRFIAQQAARQARTGGCLVAPPGQEADFLAPLPLAVLPGLPREVRRRLQLLDIGTLGEFAALKPAAVMRQFGAEATGPQVAWLHALARGCDTRPLQPERPPLRLSRTFHLADPVADRLILLNVTNRLSQKVSAALARPGYQAEALALSALLVDGNAAKAGQAVKPPTSDGAHLARLTAQLLARLPLTEPVLSLTLSIFPLRHWTKSSQQLALVSLEAQARQRRLDELFELLEHRFARGAVQPAAQVGAPPPRPADVEAGADGWPEVVELNGRQRRVEERDEQWREESLWWDPQPVRRDYYRVVLDDGSSCMVFRDATAGAWFWDRRWPQ